MLIYDYYIDIMEMYLQLLPIFFIQVTLNPPKFDHFMYSYKSLMFVLFSIFVSIA